MICWQFQDKLIRTASYSLSKLATADNRVCHTRYSATGKVTRVGWSENNGIGQTVDQGKGQPSVS